MRTPRVTRPGMPMTQVTVGSSLLTAQRGAQYPAALVASVDDGGVVFRTQAFGVATRDAIVGGPLERDVAELHPVPDLPVWDVRRIGRRVDLHGWNPPVCPSPLVHRGPAPDVRLPEPPDRRREVGTLC